MKIISKFKDYYDYLVGIYGIDEKLVLDRTDFTITSSYSDDSKVTFYICGLIIDGLYRNNKFYYGKELEQFAEPREPISRRYFRYGFWKNPNDYYSIKTINIISNKIEYLQLFKKPVIDKLDINEKLSCPILILDNINGKEVYKSYKFSKFPILKDYNFPSVFTAEEIWIKIYNFLSKTRDIPDTQTNKEKIIGKGFDYVHSFRNTK